MHLSKELWNELIKKLDDVQDLLNARQATPLLRDIVSDIIRSLKTSDFKLPAKAWKVFEQALGVVLSFDAEALQDDPKKYVKLLASLPQRLLRVRLEQCNELAVIKKKEEPFSGRIQCSTGPSRSPPVPNVVIARLCSSAFSATLQQLHLQPGVSITAAAHVLRDLPSLHTLSMTVETTRADGSYKPSTSAPLTSLHLRTFDSPCWIEQGMDVSDLAALTTLRELHLEPRHARFASKCHGVTSLSTLTQLTSFKVDFMAPPHVQGGGSTRRG